MGTATAIITITTTIIMITTMTTTIGKEMGARFHRDSMEVSDDVFSSPQSVVFDEAENRMHTIKAVLVSALK